MRTYLQVFNGGFGKRVVDLKELVDKVRFVNNQIKVDGVLTGWSEDRDFYNSLSRELKKEGIKLYFWLPVFSELDHYREFQNVINYENKELETKGFQEGENFNFYCVNNRGNIENIKSVVLEKFIDYEVDGFFLDKIRYPSFSNGLKAIFTCFCDTCVEKMKKENIDVEKLKEEIKKKKKNSEKSKNPFGIEEYKQFRYKFSNLEINKFFKFKNESIKSSLKELTDFFREKGFEVGFDLYAPHIAYFTGQDTLELSEIADFIKPMYYRAAYAPAGIPYEISMYSEGFSGTFPEEIKREFFNIIGETDNKISDKYVEKEISSLKKEPGVKNVYPGLEFNRIENIALSDEKYLKASIESFDMDGADGIVLSWNLMEMPENHLMVYIDYVKQKTK